MFKSIAKFFKECWLDAWDDTKNGRIPRVQTTILPRRMVNWYTSRENRWRISEAERKGKK